MVLLSVNHQKAHIRVWHYGLPLTFVATPLMLCLKQTLCTFCQYDIVCQCPNHSIPASLTILESSWRHMPCLQHRMPCWTGFSFSTVFAELVNCLLRGMKGLEAHFILKARRVPYALQEQVENELDKLEKHGVIKKTNRSCWASRIVATKGW